MAERTHRVAYRQTYRLNRQLDTRTDKADKVSKHQEIYITWPAKNTNRQPDSMNNRITDRRTYLLTDAQTCRQTWQEPAAPGGGGA